MAKAYTSPGAHAVLRGGETRMTPSPRTKRNGTVRLVVCKKKRYNSLRIRRNEADPINKNYFYDLIKRIIKIQVLQNLKVENVCLKMPIPVF